MAATHFNDRGDSLCKVRPSWYNRLLLTDDALQVNCKTCARIISLIGVAQDEDHTELDRNAKRALAKYSILLPEG